MDVYRIEGEWVKGRTVAYGQTFELVAGFTPKSYIAAGNWFGAVKDYGTIYPFVLTDNGHCRYSGDGSQTRYFSIVKRPVKVGEIFELTWENLEDVHCYRITKVARLNLQPDSPDEEPHNCGQPAAPDDGMTEADAEKAPGIFLKNSLIRHATRPEAFKATVESLIETGNVVAVGEDAIERVFANTGSFSDWFESIRPAKHE